MIAINSYFLVQEIHLDCKDWVDLSNNKIGPVWCSDFTLEMNCSVFELFGPVRCSDCSLEMNCSDISLFINFCKFFW